MSYYELAKRSPDRRFLPILERLGYGPKRKKKKVAKPAQAEPAQPEPVQEPDAEPVDERIALRAEYEEVTGKRPFSGWSADELRARMAAAREAEG